MREKLDETIEKIKRELNSMADLARSMIQMVTRALTERDETLLPKVYEMEETLDRRQIDMDEAIVNLLVLFAPVGLDLRFALMVARINTELERIGDQAVNMCEYVQLLRSDTEPQESTDIQRMADIATDMVSRSIQAFNEGSASLARDVIQTDSTVDAINHEVFRAMLTDMSKRPTNISERVGLVLAARSLERIADRATNMAEEVVYMIKGDDVRHAEDSG